MINIIEKQLGYSLNRYEQHALVDLNALPEEILTACKLLDKKPLRYYFLKYVMHPEEHSFLHDFIGEVLEGEKEAKTWRKGRVLVTAVSLKDQLTQPKALLLQHIGEPFFFIKKPSVPAWKGGASVGDPALIDNTATYKSASLDATMAYDSAHLQLDPVNPEKIAILYRRWIAQRIARYLLAKNLLNLRINTDMLADVASVDTWTPEALKAFNGLREELKINVSIDTIVPGYGGDDKWYE